MHTTSFSLLPCIFLVLFFCGFLCSDSCTFTITNNCPVTIWPGTLAGSGMPQLPRMGCKFDKAGMGTCFTRDCGDRLECASNGATPPASLFEITLGKGMDKDFYDVNIADGYNLPLVVEPQGVYGECNAIGCTSDINFGCPKELQVVGGDGEDGSGVIACRSACEAFGLDQYCCSGEFAILTACHPSYYSAIFKRECPRAYSYAFDYGTSTFTCKAYDYRIIFSPGTEG